MTTYDDGSSFAGLDSDCVDPDLPVDTWLDQRLMSNALMLSKTQRGCAQGFYSHVTDALNTNLGHRPYAALGWQSVTVFDIWLEPGITGFTVSGVYNVQSEGSTQSDVEAKLTIEGLGEFDLFTLANTDNAGSPAFSDFSQSWSFDGEYAGRARWARLVMWVRSQDGGTATQSVTLTGNGVPYVTASNGDLSNVSNGPASGSLELMYYRGVLGRSTEIVSMNPDGTNPEELYTYPTIIGGFSSSESVDLYYLSFVQFRSLSFAADYSARANFRSGRGDFRAKKSVRGLNEIEHALSSDAIYKRPRLIAWGPTGHVQTVDEQWASDYCQLWRYEQGDASGMDLIDASVHIDGENPRIRIRAYMISTMFGGTRGDVPGEIDWDFTLSAKQLDGGDVAWANATTIATITPDTVTMPLYPTMYLSGGADGGSRYLLMQYLLHDYGNVAGSTPESYAWVYREGSLIEGDMPLIFPVDITLDLSGFTTRQLDGVRMQLSAAYSASRGTPWGYDTGTDRMRVACVGWSMWVDNA